MRRWNVLKEAVKPPADASVSAHTVHHPSPLTYLALWFAVIAWGGSFVAARLLLHSTGRGQVALSPTVLAAARFSVAVIGSIQRPLAAAG